jgi:hypothetical protein
LGRLEVVAVEGERGAVPSSDEQSRRQPSQWGRQPEEGARVWGLVLQWQAVGEVGGEVGEQALGWALGAEVVGEWAWSWLDADLAPH